MDDRHSTQPPDCDEQACRRAALDLLARREYARAELQAKLKRFGTQCLHSTLQTLTEEGLQCDYRYACAYARERVRRGYGPLRIRAELIQRGVCEARADDALTASAADEHWNWSDLARSVLRRKFGRGSLPRDFTQRAKALRFLQYRGFPSGLIAGDDGASEQY